MDRREFLKAGVAGMALSGLAAESSNYVVASSGQKPKRYGLIGCGWYGKSAMFRLLQIAPVEVVSLCDVDSKMLAEAAEMVAARQSCSSGRSSTSCTSPRPTTGTHWR